MVMVDMEAGEALAAGDTSRVRSSNLYICRFFSLLFFLFPRIIKM
jgi:hypothetical protein